MNDHIFAKLYEKDGRQVLVVKDADDENGNPQIQIHTSTLSGARASMILTFGSKEGECRDEDWDKRDAYFDKIDEEGAWKILPPDKLLKL